MAQTALASKCPCGHLAVYHPSRAQQTARLAASGGRYTGECKGGLHVHCRCIVSREDVTADATPTPSTTAVVAARETEEN